MSFYKTNNPNSYRSPFFKGRKKQKTVTPPVTADRLIWRFENNLTEAQGSGFDLTPQNGYTPLFVTGKIDSFAIRYSDASVYPLKILNVGLTSPFDLSFQKSWAIQFWCRNNNSSELQFLGIAPTTANSTISNNIWSVRFSLSQTQFSFKRNAAGNTRFIFQSHTNPGADTWFYVWLIHDIATPKQLVFGFNNTFATQQVSVSDEITYPASVSTLTFQLACLSSPSNRQLDELAIFNEQKDPAFFIDLYDSGDGKPVPLS